MGLRGIRRPGSGFLVITNWLSLLARIASHYLLKETGLDDP